MQLGNIFANHIEFQIHWGSFLYQMKISMLIGVGDNSDRKMINFRIDYSKAHAINANRAFLDGNIFFIVGVFKIKNPTALSKFNFFTISNLVHVALNNMTVQTAVHFHGPF